MLQPACARRYRERYNFSLRRASLKRYIVRAYSFIVANRNIHRKVERSFSWRESISWIRQIHRSKLDIRRKYWRSMIFHLSTIDMHSKQPYTRMIIINEIFKKRSVEFFKYISKRFHWWTTENNGVKGGGGRLPNRETKRGASYIDREKAESLITALRGVFINAHSRCEIARFN